MRTRRVPNCRLKCVYRQFHDDTIGISDSLRKSTKERSLSSIEQMEWNERNRIAQIVIDIAVACWTRDWEKQVVFSALFRCIVVIHLFLRRHRWPLQYFRWSLSRRRLLLRCLPRLLMKINRPISYISTWRINYVDEFLRAWIGPRASFAKIFAAQLNLFSIEMVSFRDISEKDEFIYTVLGQLFMEAS